MKDAAISSLRGDIRYMNRDARYRRWDLDIGDSTGFDWILASLVVAEFKISLFPR